VAIVVHAARATRDWLRAGVRRGERTYHVLSDLGEPEGGRELRDFIERLGLPTRFVQYPGTYREHFDAPGRYGETLFAHGARLVTTHELGELLRRKRNARDSRP
jgi:hypothetical protein